MRVKSLFTAVVIIVCMVLCTVSSSSDTVCTIDECEEIMGIYNFGENDFAVLYISGRTYHIAVTDGDNVNLYDTEMSADTNAVSYVGENLFFFENVIEEEVPAVKICRYDCRYNTKNYSVLNSDIKILQGSCAVNNNGDIYFIDGRDVKVYSDYKLADTINVPSVPLTLIPSYGGEVIYCITGGEITAFADREYYTLPVQSDYIYPAQNGFSDCYGTVYSLDGTVLCDKFDGTHGSVEANDCYFGISGGKLVQIYNEKETVLCEMSSSEYLCMGSDRFICVGQNGSTAEILFMSNEPVKSDVFSDSVTDSESKESKVNLAGFDINGDMLCGITPGTTVAQMRKMLDPKNCTVTFYSKDGTEKKSGVIGTGCTVEIEGDYTQKYTLIIYGDISGEGSINTSDRREMMKYLLYNETAGKAKREASDLNHDGIIDLIDLTALNNYINGEGSISQYHKNDK